MENIQLNKKSLAILVATISLSIALPSLALALNDVQIVNNTDFQINTSDTAAATTFTASADGQVTNFDVQPNYIDITLDLASNATFNMVTPGRFFSISTISGAADTVTLVCPKTNIAIAGTGAQTVLRLQVQAADPCIVPPAPSGGGGGGGSAQFGQPSSSGGGGGGGSSSNTSNNINNLTPNTQTPDNTQPLTFFSDSTSHWASSYAEKLHNQCGVDGYLDASGQILHEFKPDSTITRRELVKMVMQCKYGKQVMIASDAPFPDINLQMWGVNEIAQAKKDGMIQGEPNGNFAPDINVIRSEAAKIIELAKHTITEVNGSDLSALIAFKDIVSGAWYEHFVAFGVSNHFFEGYQDNSGNLTGFWGPQNNLTRGEAAKIIVNVFGL